MKCLFDEMGDPTLGHTDEHGGVDSDSTIHRVTREDPGSQPLRPGVGPVVLELLAHDDDVTVGWMCVMIRMIQKRTCWISSGDNQQNNQWITTHIKS